MGMTASEKILARACGLGSVKPGDVVHPKADWVFLHDLQVPVAKRDLDALGIDQVSDPDRVVFVTDHEVLYTSPAMIEKGGRIRRAAADWGIKHFYDVGQGGHGHIFPIEDGMVQPGMFIFANDMHCTNFGAAGAFGMRVGSEVNSVLVMGTVWTLVPKSVRLTLTGRRPPGVYGRDVGFRVSRHLANGDWGVDIVYRVLELAGPALEDFDLDQRVALTNTPCEISAIGIYIPPSPAVLAHLSRLAGKPVEGLYSDPDAVFEHDISFDISKLEPQVALPGAPEASVDISEVAGKHVDHTFIGSCGSGMYEDMVTAAEYLRGRHVARNTRLFIVPGTVKTAQRLASEGLMQLFQDAGAIILPSGCGPCTGGNMGPLGSGERSICTAAVNTHGRMGAKDAEIFLASPATVAASALEGHITDPRHISTTPIQRAA